MAKKFNFRLDSVLKLRAHATKTEKMALMDIVSKRFAKENDISKKEEYYKSLLEQRNGKIKASDFQAGFSHMNFVKSEISKLNEEKKHLIEIETLQRDRLNSAQRDEKVIDKLKEKKKLSYLDDLNKEETIVLDEIARNRHGKT